MATPYIPFSTTISYTGGGFELLDSSMELIINETDLELKEYDSQINQLLFRDKVVMSPRGEVSSVMGAYELDVINEGSVYPEQFTAKLPGKGYDLKIYAGKFTTTRLMTEWIKAAKTLQGADSSVRREWDEFANKAKNLYLGMQKNRMYDRINVWYKGLQPISAVNGAGSPTPRGKPLFSSTHPYRNGTATYSNVLINNPALTAVSLQDAITTLRSRVRLENGSRVSQARTFKLYVGAELSVQARIILNTPGSQAGIYSGVLANANQVNQFSFQGNMVELVTIPYFGDLDKNNQQLGLESMWFLVNEDAINMYQGFVCHTLGGIHSTSRFADDTKNFVVDLQSMFQADHYNAQVGICGSLGDGSPTQA